MEKINIIPVNILGGSFVGNFLVALCFGVLTIQTSSYYYAFPNDARPAKLAVAFLWCFEAFQLVCVTRTLYYWFVENNHNYFILGWATWGFFIFQINTVCTSFTVQTFFAHRVYSLSGNIYVGVLVQVLVLLQFGFGVATSVKVNMNLEFQAIVKECKWIVVSWLTIQAIADIVIATLMCLSLRRRRTGFQKTDSAINRMVLYTISTGLITSVLSCFLLVMFAKYGFHISELALGMPLGACYSVTMLANLHMRTTLRARLATSSPIELPVKKRMWQNAVDRGSEEPPQVTRINITTEVVSDEVDIKPMNSDARVRFAAVQSLVLGGTGDLTTSPRFRSREILPRSSAGAPRNESLTQHFVACN